MRAAISGLGMWLPPTVRTNEAWTAEFLEAARARGDRTLVDIPPSGDELERVTLEHLAEDARDPFLGSVQRHVAVDEPSWLGETHAAKAALVDAGLEAGDVDVVMSWAALFDRPCLPNATKVAHEIGAPGAWAFGADAGCASALVQLELAAALIESGRARHVLLTQSHFFTRSFPLSHPASPSVGDSATALVVSARERSGVLGVRSFSHGDYWDAVTYMRGFEANDDPPWWEAGGPYVLGSKSPANTKRIMQDTVRNGVDTVRAAFERARISVSEMQAFASVHPRKWIPGAILGGLGVDPSLTRTTFERTAHVGGCGVVANLLALREAGQLREGSLVGVYAQGAGFTRSAAVLRW